MNQWLLIAIGSGVGGASRFWLSALSHSFLGRQFPYGTLLVNTVGCFLMGLLFVILVDRMDVMAQHLRSLLVIGFLGGFTTFSAFSMETINLFENGQLLSASLNIVLNIGLCIALSWLGVVLARQ